MNRDEPILFALEKQRAISDAKGPGASASPARTQEQMAIMKTEIFTSVQERWVPNTVVLDYIKAIYPAFEDFWLFRRQFAYQFAASTFLTYVMHMGARYPNKMSIKRGVGGGDVWVSELVPQLNPAKAFFYNSEAVPVRLTPNIQVLIGPVGLEGIFTAGVMAIARCLTEHGSGGTGGEGSEMEGWLSLFVRDEMITWAAGKMGDKSLTPNQLRDMVDQNCGFVVRRAVGLARTPEENARANNQDTAQAGVGQLPACQSVVDLVSKAGDPVKLSSMDALWMAWL